MIDGEAKHNGRPPPPFLQRNVRRFRTYRGRIKRMLLNSNLKHRCCYVHVPKSGGTSLIESLIATVPMNQQVGTIESIGTRRAVSLFKANTNSPDLFHEDQSNAAELFEFHEQLLIYFMSRRMALVHGHFLFSELAYRHFHDEYKFVSFLRYPVHRLISNFRNRRYYKMNFDEYLESDVARRHALVNLRYFSGRAEIPRGEEEKHMDRAREVMGRFSVLGFLDDMPGFERRFAEVFGERLRIYHYNKSKRPPLNLSREQIGKIEALCQPDIELHEYARSLFP